MPSSDRLPDWTSFALREVPKPVEILSPAAEAAALLPYIVAERRAADNRAGEATRELARAAGEQAVLVFQLASALERYEKRFTEAGLQPVYRHLRVLKDQMRDALGQASIMIEDPAGKSFDSVAALVEVEGWRHSSEFTSEVVAEVSQPIVRFKGAVARLGRVVMGAPQEKQEGENDAVDQ